MNDEWRMQHPLRVRQLFQGVDRDSIQSAMHRITSVNDSARLIVEAHRLGLDVDALRQKEYLRFDRQS